MPPPRKTLDNCCDFKTAVCIVEKFFFWALSFLETAIKKFYLNISDTKNESGE